MKKLLLMLTVILTVIGANAQKVGKELKGYEIGSKYSGSKIVETTVGKIPCYISISTLKDSSIFRLTVITKNRRVSYRDVEILKNGLIKKFNITSKKRYKNKYSSDYSITQTVKSINYWINVKYNKYASPRYKIAFIIKDLNLEKIYKKEQQEKANTDF